MKLRCALWIVVFWEVFFTNRVAAVSSVLLTENVAVNKPCNMSEAYYYEGEEGHDVVNNSCSAANNNNTSTIKVAGNCIRTHWDVRTPQWTVNLEQVYTIYKITIYPTSGSESLMTDVMVQVENNAPQPVPSTTNTDPLDVVLSPPQSGSTVTVFRPDPGSSVRTYNYLRFCEVQVWAAIPGYRNLAEGKLCYMSPWYFYNVPSQPEWYNVDNNTCHAANNGNTSTAYAKGNCIFTHWDDHNPHWTVMLGTGRFQVYNIVIFRAVDEMYLSGLMTNVRVLVDGQVVMTFPRISSHNPPPAIPLVTDIPISPPRAAHNITVIRDYTSDKYTYMRLCEVQVWGTCESGFYGVSCDQTCQYNQGCQPHTCSPLDGHCVCRDGWKTPLCTECASGRYEKISDCQMRCGGGCSGGICRDDGTCNCRPRWQSPNCDRCDDDHYGLSTDCVHQCGAGCNGCNEDGTCIACKTHFVHMPSCDHCETQHYGSDCSSVCGHCAGQGGCGRADGHCPGDCQAGWKPPTCVDPCDTGTYGVNCRETCSNGCERGACDATTGTCTCRPNWGPNTTQPSLCNECLPGHYSTSVNCTYDCGHCAGGAVCNKDTGLCSSCQPGWVMPLCQQVCPQGRFGQNCSSTCGQGCVNGNCNATNGACACRTGWGPGPHGEQCTECAAGHYNKSSDCSQQCGHCVNGTMCDKNTGQCPACAPGWVPPLCHQECEDGHYGQNCNETCGHCVGNKICDRTHGQCQTCEAGYQLPVCKLPCPDGRYGKNCEGECGHCANEAACDRSDGTCPLFAGLTRCESSFEPPLCRANDGADSQSKNQDSPNLVGPIVGSILGAGAMIAVAVIASQWMKRRRTNSNSGVQSPSTQEEQRDKNTVAMDPIPSSAPETGSLAAPTTNRRLPAAPPEDAPRVQSEVYEVIRENNYDSLHPYVNDFNPDRDVYTHIQDQ